MKKALVFAAGILEEADVRDMMSIANEMTYKVLLAVFPFIIFLMSLLGFLEIDGNRLMIDVSPYLPDQVMSVFTAFIDEVIDFKSRTLLSSSLLVVVFSASSGFRAIMRGINRSYGVTEHRGFLRASVISVLLTLMLAAVISLSLVVLIFSDGLRALLSGLIDTAGLAWRFYNLAVFVFFVIILLLSIMVIYKASLNRKTTLRAMFPGAAVTVVLWLLASKLFNVYVNNFSRYSKIYGSIGSVFILIIWINIIAFILLVGNEINALLEKRARKPAAPG